MLTRRQSRTRKTSKTLFFAMEINHIGGDDWVLMVDCACLGHTIQYKNTCTDWKWYVNGGNTQLDELPNTTQWPKFFMTF